MRQYMFRDPRHALWGMTRSLMRDEGVDIVAPRNQFTREIRHVTMTIERPEDCLPTGMGRKFNSALAAAETLQLLGGFADPQWMSRVAPDYLKFTGGAMTGAYGPRLTDQLPIIVDTLRNDRDSRQAVATIWEPDRDLLVEHGDRPCTVYVSFMVRHGELITSTYMRSQDVYLGLTYDLVMFTQLHQSVANVLGLPSGSLVHTVQSLHLYERDIMSVRELTEPPTQVKQRLRGLNGESWDDVRDTARIIAYQEVVPTFLTAGTESWLRSHSGAARGSE